jgi:hypothetical protein
VMQRSDPHSGRVSAGFDGLRGCSELSGRFEQSTEAKR